MSDDVTEAIRELTRTISAGNGKRRLSRDEWAAVMVAFFGSNQTPFGTQDQLCRTAYEYADAMLAASKPDNGESVDVGKVMESDLAEGSATIDTTPEPMNEALEKMHVEHWKRQYENAIRERDEARNCAFATVSNAQKELNEARAEIKRLERKASDNFGSAEIYRKERNETKAEIAAVCKERDELLRQIKSWKVQRAEWITERERWIADGNAFRKERDEARAELNAVRQERDEADGKLCDLVAAVERCFTEDGCFTLRDAEAAKAAIKAAKGEA